MPELIPNSPENVARAIMAGPATGGVGLSQTGSRIGFASMNEGPSAQIMAWVMALSFIGGGIWLSFEVGNPIPAIVATIPAFFVIRWFG